MQQLGDARDPNSNHGTGKKKLSGSLVEVNTIRRIRQMNYTQAISRLLMDGRIEPGFLR